jgi:hypothetical protein
MSATYVRDGRDDTAAGRVILVFVSSLSALLVLGALVYFAGTGSRHQAAVLAAGCEPSLYKSGLPCTTQQMLATQYAAVVNPATRQLTTDAAVYTASENRNLTTAQAVLQAEVTTEQALTSGVTAMTYTSQNRSASIALITTAADAGNPIPSAAILFTPPITVLANALIRANQARAALTAEQARATSLARMRAFNARIAAATASVQAEEKLISAAIATPPRDS